MHPAPTWRLLGLLAVALLLAGLAPVLLERERTVRGPPGPSRAAERRRRAAGADCDPGRVPDRGGAARVDDPPARVGHRQRNRRGSLRAAGRPRALQRDQRMGQDRDPARGGGAAVRRRAAARVRAAGARRRPPGRGGASADRARGRAGDARPPEVPVPAGPAAVRAAGVLHVGRAGAVRPARRGAARLRGDGRDRDGGRPRARPALALDQLRGADARLHAVARGPVRLDAAIRAVDLAAERRHGPRRPGLPEGVPRGVLEGGEPRHVRRGGLGRGWRQHRRRARGRERPHARPLHPERHGHDPRDEHHRRDRRRVRGAARRPI